MKGWSTVVMSDLALILVWFFAFSIVVVPATVGTLTAVISASVFLGSKIGLTDLTLTWPLIVDIVRALYRPIFGFWAIGYVLYTWRYQYVFYEQKKITAAKVNARQRRYKALELKQKGRDEDATKK